MLESPVVFFVFNRPQTTAKVWSRIRDARPRRLFVVADAPRLNRPADNERCAEVQRLVENVDWTCEVERCYSTKNLGAALRVSSGLDWVFSLVEEAIILEDDCFPDPTFFPFCSQLLERYRNDEKIAQIAGCSFQTEKLSPPSSYYFSLYPHGWGWATWRRAWRLYDHSMQTWRTQLGAEWLASVIQDEVERKVWANAFDDTLSGKVDAWDYRWAFAVWRARMLSILPYRNLVSNIGFGSDATHTTGSPPWAALPVNEMAFPLIHPTSIQRDEAADQHTSGWVFRPPSLTTRLQRRWQKIFR